MPNRLSEEKARSIAAEYCTNGFKKVVALLSVGYSTTYANNVGLKLFDNSSVKAAIACIQAKQAAKTDYTQEKGLELLLDAYKVAKTLNQPAAMVSAAIGANRMHGYDKDAAIGEKVTIIIGPRIESGVKAVESEVIE